MKKILSICVFTLAFIAITIGSGFAGKGKGQGDGSGGLLIDECPYAFDISGEVLQNQQGGLIVQNDDDGLPYTVWGLGPSSFWGDIAKPIGGDYVTIKVVNCGDEEPRYVAITVIFEDQTMELRDPITCYPLWR